MLCKSHRLYLSTTVLSSQYFSRRSLLLSSQLRNSEVKLSWRISSSSANFMCTLVRRVFCIEYLCSTLPSIHEKVGWRLGPSHLTLSTSSRPSSAHLSAFSLKNSPWWALILIKMVKRPRLSLWCSTLMMRARMSPSREWRSKGCFPSLNQFEETVIKPFESVRTAIGWSWVPKKNCWWILIDYPNILSIMVLLSKVSMSPIVAVLRNHLATYARTNC